MTLTNPINPRTSAGRRVALIFGAAEHHCGLRVCSGCGLWIGLARELAEGAIGREVCPACVVQTLPAVDGSKLIQAQNAREPSVRRHFLEVCHE
jgi:hypothetical protein